MRLTRSRTKLFTSAYLDDRPVDPHKRIMNSGAPVPSIKRAASNVIVAKTGILSVSPTTARSQRASRIAWKRSTICSGSPGKRQCVDVHSAVTRRFAMNRRRPLLQIGDDLSGSQAPLFGWTPRSQAG